MVLYARRVCRNPGNPGRPYDESVDITNALLNHYDPNSALVKVKETASLLNKTSKKLSPEQKKERGWDDAYDLRPWHEYPDTQRITIPGIILQNLSGGWLGIGGGPTKDDLDFASKLRVAVSSGCMKSL